MTLLMTITLIKDVTRISRAVVSIRNMSNILSNSSVNEKYYRNTRDDLENKYQKAITCLNKLQSNAATIEKSKNDPTKSLQQIPSMEKYLGRVGIAVEELNKLSVIHVAGTKGKGSTCAFTESILHKHGYKTGFFSSPHLVSATERIRINGKPVSKEIFLHHFWDVYTNLNKHKSDDADMPSYFKFLTVLSLKLFLREQVDVAILEVGIGGEYDCTNIIRKPIVCGISSLGIDHTSLLGTTIDSIAWHKSGIMKAGVPCFTVEQRFKDSYKVMMDRAIEKETDLLIAPSLEQYDWGGCQMQLGLSGSVQYLNSSLALQLSQYWLANHAVPEEKRKRVEYCQKDTPHDLLLNYASSFALSEEDISGLKSAVWPGRMQILQKEHITYFLDGAHTMSSIEACIDWFNNVSPRHSSSDNCNPAYKVLIFNSTGDREPEILLKPFLSSDFDMVIFTTNLATAQASASSDQKNYKISDDMQRDRCNKHRNSWLQLLNEKSKDGKDTSVIFPCINDALIWLSCGRTEHITGEFSTSVEFLPPKQLQYTPHLHILVTGSLYLVGGVLKLIDPNLSSATLTTNKENSMATLLQENYKYSSSPATP